MSRNDYICYIWISTVQFVVLGCVRFALTSDLWILQRCLRTVRSEPSSAQDKEVLSSRSLIILIGELQPWLDGKSKSDFDIILFGSHKLTGSNRDKTWKPNKVSRCFMTWCIAHGQGALTTLREANSELREAQADLRAYPATRLKLYRANNRPVTWVMFNGDIQ